MSFGIELFQFHSFGVNRHTSAFQHQFIFGYSFWWPSLSTLELEAIYLFVVSSIRPFLSLSPHWSNQCQLELSWRNYELRQRNNKTLTSLTNKTNFIFSHRLPKTSIVSLVCKRKKYSLQVLVNDFEQILEALTFYNYKAQITSLTILLPDH